jgi:hypothetical protein
MLFNHGKPNYLIRLTQPNVNMHGHPSLIMSKGEVDTLITRPNMSTSPQNIHKWKLVQNVVVEVRFGKTCIVFLTMARNIISTKEKWKGHSTQGHWHRLTFKTKCFHKQRRAYNHCKCEQHYTFRKHLIYLIIF